MKFFGGRTGGKDKTGRPPQRSHRVNEEAAALRE
jgi:hypothetical protein